MRTIVRCFLFLAAVPLAIGAAPVTRVNVDDSEARAALYILHKLQRHAVPTDRDWAQLFGTSGYKRLKAREAEFKRPFTDDDFKKFVTGPSVVAKASVLKTTLDAWTSADRSQIEARARAYLPDGAVLHATIYPLIKPKTNSFVYQLDTDPAVMLYVNPAVSADQFSNTVSHELLHVGDAENCPPPDVATSEKNFTVRQKAFQEWLSAFGEGWAVLAAAGGPNVHPHWEDSAADRAVWDAAMSRFATDFADLQTFFSQISDGSLAGDAIAAKGFTFFGDVQGPWYTVGYKMDVTIERALGRPALVSALCDKRSYLHTYNVAAQTANERAQTKLPLWPQKLASFLSPPPSHGFATSSDF